MVTSEIAKLWENEQVVPLLTQLKLIPKTAEYYLYSSEVTASVNNNGNSEIPPCQTSYPDSKTLQCNACETSFETREDHVAHYSTDWHLLNIKRSLVGQSCINKQDFDNYVSQINDEEDSADELSDASSENDSETCQYNRSSQIFFKNGSDQIISMFRSLLYGSKESPTNQQDILNRAGQCSSKLYWVIILFGLGGDFAGAVFKGSELIVHTTYHSYISRKKSGKAQVAHDNKNHAKSAGANIRRLNTQKYFVKVRDILVSWKEHLDKCDIIFSRCPKRLLPIVFSEMDGLLKKEDPRIHNIPFITGKPTFEEVKKVHNLLSGIQLYTQEEFDQHVEKSIKQTVSNNNRKIRTSPKPNQLTYTRKSSSSSESSESFISNYDGALESLDNLIIEPENTNATIPSKMNPIHLSRLKDIIYTACCRGNLEEFKSLWNFCQDKSLTEEERSSRFGCYSDAMTASLISDITHSDVDITIFKFGKTQNSYLHVAAMNGQSEMIWWLLSNDHDPSILNDNDLTPYQLCVNRAAKTTFRRFYGDYPKKYDYSKTKIPGPLSEEELNKLIHDDKEKKKRLLQKRKEKQKAKKLEEQKKQQEKAAIVRFEKLTDREKRALAAERRLKSTNEGYVGLRCFICGHDMTGIVPFDFMEDKFCSTACVKKQRSINAFKTGK